MHIHELPDWPHLRWDRERLAEPLAAVRHRQGWLIGHMEALGFQLQQEAVLQTLTTDVVKTSAPFLRPALRTQRSPSTPAPSPLL